jgi:hypothetical protein
VVIHLKLELAALIVYEITVLKSVFLGKLRDNLTQSKQTNNWYLLRRPNFAIRRTIATLHGKPQETILLFSALSTLC